MSTKLYAPQVRAIQPAFVYDTDNLDSGKVRIYFSLSPYNSLSNFTHIRMTAIDPNQASTWGTNTILINEQSFLDIDKNILISLENSEYFYFDFNLNNFKLLTKNQYYQIQLRLVNEEQVSDPSQISLIRPIGQPTLNIGIEDNATINELKVVSGNLNYEEELDEVETLAKYNIKIKHDGQEVYSLKNIYNMLGNSFSSKINYLFKEGKTYSVEVDYETLNGYKPEESTSVNFTFSSGNPSADESKKLLLELIPQEGAVQGLVIVSNPGTYYIQRSNESSKFLAWEDIFQIEKEGNISQNLIIKDYLTEGGNLIYKYRVRYKLGETIFIVYPESQILVNFDDIFLTDETGQLGIRFNTNVSGLKYVTQESITNTLGGKYPIIRKNAQTKYRQFNLSGTLYFDCVDIGNNKDFQDSSNRIYTDSFFEDETIYLMLKPEKAFEFWDQYSWDSDDDIKGEKLIAYQKRFRDAAMDLLTNGKPKLFRSPTEGNMLVSLSNISFTPNKTLGRNVYDFSATVTEIAEPTVENLGKYKIITRSGEFKYMLPTENVQEGRSIHITPYILPQYYDADKKAVILIPMEV